MQIEIVIEYKLNSFNKKKKCAVIQLPGSNCEYETLKALHYVGLNADIVSWNAKLDDIKSYAAFIIPGGFSFQDRVRAGAIAAQLPVFKVIKEKAQEGAAVLGICNGCQILAELGVFNEENVNETYFALAPNVKKMNLMDLFVTGLMLSLKIHTKIFLQRSLLKTISSPYK